MAGFQIRKGLIEGGLLGGKSEVVEGLWNPVFMIPTIRIIPSVQDTSHA
jgi:hypothetical protein